MKVQKIDHVGINVNDLSAAKAFFLDIGFEVRAEWEMEGELLDRVVGLRGAKTACIALGASDSQAWIELVKYDHPSDENEIQQTHANTPGIRHIAIEVEDIEAIVAKLKQKGMETFSEIQQYEQSYKLCYVRGPEGIILELAEKVK
ncbi:catechol 2,3-dioxygenase-like lactoylglutathione lyase family enzyme [Paenibacillus rhizosphaerae]|uniref:Catechol 2,3-dioxygenase-like lactoylglutathione lyase family enzyme n=1 Tax=Paenibacillus rhizosphaerae TaxID=297318 RepID=A0A839TRB3_9BACL|nr:VOC family protein [Paenibacillus rhizosphaerae]MBB3128210.1 catechol 2,3-dioxygenase-like lactoylglutathione lyase family enzyme [Paenibacillus rhizosphaerae]